MAKQAPNAMIDASLAYVAASTILHVCSGEPANYAGIAAVSLADIVLTAGDGNGDFTIADDTSGRKVTVSEQADIDIDADGTATHIALATTGDSTLRYVTTCTSQALVNTGTVTVPAFKINIADPT